MTQSCKGDFFPPVICIPSIPCIWRGEEETRLWNRTQVYMVAEGGAGPGSFPKLGYDQARNT